MATIPDFRIRIPLDLKEQIRKSAELHNRSMNGEIIARLEQSFEGQDEQGATRFTPDELKEIAICLAHFYKENPDFATSLK